VSKCILDTSIIIDLANGNLLEIVLKLEYTFCVPDLIQSELIDPPGKELDRIGYRTISLSPDDIVSLLKLIDRYGKPSKKDLAALQCAKSSGSLLLTGDKHLRDAAEREGLSTHGLLWIIDRLVETGLLEQTEASAALEKILNAGSWLPKDECEKRFRKWGKY
jgi:predicted nucleic acid-binding protein